MLTPSIPPGAENGAFLLLDLIRNPDLFDAKVKTYADERGRFEAAQAVLDESKRAGEAQLAQIAAEQTFLAEQIEAAALQKRVAAERTEAVKKLETEVKHREHNVELAEQTLDAKVQETGAALAAREAAVAQREADVGAREEAVAKREADAAALIADYEDKIAKLRATVG